MKKIYIIVSGLIFLVALNLLLGCTALGVLKIEIETFPDKLVYYSNQSLDVSGGTIRVTFEDQTNKVIDMTSQMITNFDSSNENPNLLLKVLYKGCEISFSIRVFGEETGFGSNGLAYKPISDTECEVSIGIADIYYQLTKILIPETYNGLTVTKITPRGFDHVETLEEIYLPKTIVNISDNVDSHGSMFNDCLNLKVIEVDPNNPVYDSRDNSNAVIVSATNALIVACQATIIPNSVTTIGAGAFSGIQKLTSIVIPSNVKTVYAFAFANCFSLEEVSIENGVNEIWYAAFQNCTSFKKLVIPNSVTKLVEFGDYGIFKNCISLEKVQLSSNITTLPKGLFKDCVKLTDVLLPKNITSLPDEIFDNCLSLKTITLPDNIQTIDGPIFKNNPNLEKVFLPDKLKTIPKELFSGCINLKTVEFGSLLETIEDKAFYQCEQLTVVVVPNSVVTIGNQVFEDCYNLETIKLPNGLITIGQNNFAHCYKLETIDLPKDMETLENEIFGNCYGFDTYLIPKTINTIKGAPFNNCGTVTLFFESSIPATLVDVDFSNIDALVVADDAYDLYTSSWPTYLDKIFAISTYEVKEYDSLEYNLIDNNSSYEVSLRDKYSVSNNQEIIIPDTYQGLPVTKIADYGFAYAKNVRSIYISKNITKLGIDCLLSISSLQQIVVDEENPVYDSRNQCNAIVKTSTNELIVTCATTIIDQSVVSINSNAFNGNNFITSLSIPGSIVTIADSLFNNNTGLKEVYIEEGITTIGSESFAGCLNLIKVILPNSLLTIKNKAFSDCVSLESITLPGNIQTMESYIFNSCVKLNEVIIQEGITSIPEYAFYKCSNLRNVDIANTVVSVWQYAFAECSSLYEIYLPDSITSLGKYLFLGCEVLYKIRLSDNITVLPEGFIYGCRNITIINIPKQMTSIVFYNHTLFTTHRIVLTNIDEIEKFKNLEIHAFYLVSSKFQDYVEENYLGFADHIIYYDELN